MSEGPVIPGARTLVTPDSPPPPPYASLTSPSPTMAVASADIETLTQAVLNVQAWPVSTAGITIGAGATVAANLDFSTGNKIYVVLDASNTTVNFTVLNPYTGGTFYVFIDSGATPGGTTVALSFGGAAMNSVFSGADNQIIAGAALFVGTNFGQGSVARTLFWTVTRY